MNRSDGLEQRLAALELTQILYWADSGASNGSLDWYECRGEDFSIAPPGFGAVGIATVLPPSRVVGNYIRRIQKGDMSVLGRPDDNEISLALKFEYGGKSIVLGGDGTFDNWTLRARYEQNKGCQLAGHVVNLPHHGSKYDCKPEVRTRLFANAGERYGVTSANGISHPDVEVIEWLEDHSIAPFCTNLIPSCGANAQRLLVLPGVEPQLARWIREVADAGEIQICQGDVTIQITDLGHVTVIPEYNNPCAYRGDYERLFGV